MSPKPQPLDLEAVQAAVAPILRVHGVELVDLEWTTTPSGRTLRVTIERPGSTDVGGGVSLDDCAEVSRDLSSTLDADDPIDGAYNLEVSSPGLDRPLRKHQDFVRFSGNMAKLKLSRPEPDGQRALRGVIHADDGADTIRCEVDGRVHEIPLSAIAAAHLVFEWGPAPKPTGRKKAGSSPRATAKKASPTTRSSGGKREGAEGDQALCVRRS